MRAPRLPGRSGSCGQRGRPAPPAAWRHTHPHTCANIRPPPGKTAPLCLAWHRRPRPRRQLPSRGRHGPWADHCSHQALGRLGPPVPGRWGRRPPLTAAAAPQLSAPPRLELWAAFLAHLRQQSCRNVSRAPAGGLRGPGQPASAPSGCFLAVSFVLGVSATPGRPGPRLPAGRGPQARPLPMCALGPLRTQTMSQRCGGQTLRQGVWEMPPAGFPAESRGVLRAATFADACGPVRPWEPCRCPQVSSASRLSRCLLHE